MQGDWVKMNVNSNYGILAGKIVSRESTKTPPGSPPYQPPPPPPSTGPSGASRSPGASGSLQVPPPPPLPPSTNQEDLQMDEDMAPDEQAQSSGDEDIGDAHITKASALTSNYSPPPKDSLLAQTGDIAIFIDWFYFEYLRFGSKCSKPALSISKMTVAYYLEVGLEQMVPDQMWIDEECKYDIVAIIEVFSMYGYDYMKKIVLRLTNLNEHVITERDFKYLYPSDFNDLYLLNLQENFIGGRVRDGDYRVLKQTERSSHFGILGKDCAKITKKQSKPDKIEHEIEKIAQKPDPRTFPV
uniref:Uncharacterized protein n=1 Tax=Tanacetum cinerariifolium TaxID=118510 RepID=A0A6L2MUM0_TANCI|nr:hypothetical protein [Tanacetum cinerariifolium]